MEKKTVQKQIYVYYEWLQSQFHKKNTVFAKIWHYYLQPEAQKIIMKLNHYIPTQYFTKFFFRILSTIPPPLPPHSLILLLSDKILL